MSPLQSLAVMQENLDESRVPAYTLPDPLVCVDGLRVTSADEWKAKRRPEILRLFETEVYGKAPREKPQLEFTVESKDDAALGGKAIREEVTIAVSTRRGSLPLHLLVYMPKAAKPVPAFVGLNFNGNQAVASDPQITLAQAWIGGHRDQGIENHHATEKSRGVDASRWQVEKLIDRGYALATMCCNDIEPDFAGGFPTGVHKLFFREGQTAPDDDEWGTLAAWAWGLSRALDYLETDPKIDVHRVAVIGHSRLGKAALWAGASDPRFAAVISNESGCGGAALSKRIFGETVGQINTNFPHWFCRNFRKYNDREATLPVDQHELIALVAPRPVYVASAHEDRHADPKGEFLAIKNAEPVYRLFGIAGLGEGELPAVNHPVGGVMHYHIRSGKHDTTAYDWDQYLDFADRYLVAK